MSDKPVIEQANQKISEIEQTEKRLAETKQVYQAIIDFYQSGQQLEETITTINKIIAEDNYEPIHRLLLSVFAFIKQLEGRFGMDDPLHCWLEEQCGERTDQEREDQEEALRTMPYPEYLQTDHWKFTREFKIYQAGQRCQLCNAYGVQLNVHHRTYERRGREIEADLIVLCQNCHEIFHTNGKLAKQN